MDERVRAVVQLLEESGFATLTIAQLADAAALSPSRLQHLFKRDTGLSIRTFLKSRRLELAAHLIVSTEQRVSEILYSVGYSDFSNFDHDFKRRFGVSPREYRIRVRRLAQTRDVVLQPGYSEEDGGRFG